MGLMIMCDLNNSPQEGETAMSSAHEAKKGTSRRIFVKEVTFGAACVTVAGALSALNVDSVSTATDTTASVFPIR